jgi:hypothetical protein
MEKLIEVSHMNGAWCVEVQGALQPTLFLSGGRAESAARRLACCLARLGHDARVHIRDKQNLLVGKHRYFG